MIGDIKGIIKKSFNYSVRLGRTLLEKEYITYLLWLSGTQYLLRCSPTPSIPAWSSLRGRTEENCPRQLCRKCRGSWDPIRSLCRTLENLSSGFTTQSVIRLAPIYFPTTVRKLFFLFLFWPTWEMANLSFPFSSSSIIQGDRVNQVSFRRCSFFQMEQSFFFLSKKISTSFFPNSHRLSRSHSHSWENFAHAIMRDCRSALQHLKAERTGLKRGDTFANTFFCISNSGDFSLSSWTTQRQALCSKLWDSRILTRIWNA